MSYNALTRQYRVASGLLTQTFNSLEEVERFIGRITSRPVASADALTKGAKYDAAVRLRLDVNQLPKPFQVNALASTRVDARVRLAPLELHAMSAPCVGDE